jgi:hypothetical protein
MQENTNPDIFAPRYEASNGTRLPLPTGECRAPS